MRFRTANSQSACFFIILCGLFAISAAAQGVPDRPNILWITAEDLSPAIGAYGDPAATTPNIDRLAERGILYQNAWATAPICAPARSTLITGVYATSTGTQHLRSEIELPEWMRILPEYLRDEGYFTFLYGKTDYNFDPEGRWDRREEAIAPWRARQDDRPFFGMYTFGTTHEGSGNIPARYEESVANLPEELFHDPDALVLPPYYPDTPELRRLWAQYYNTIAAMDRQVGDVLAALKADGLDDDTIVFFFSDHGFGLPRYKRWLNKTGMHVPLVVHVPEKYRHLTELHAGSETDQLVSFVDFAPTALSLAGTDIPEHMQGHAFLGPRARHGNRYLFGARSRADNMYEVSRSVFDGRYLYVRH